MDSHDAPNERPHHRLIHRLDTTVDKPNRATATCATLRTMEMKAYGYRDPGQVLRDVTAVHPLIEGGALIALVLDPTGAQQVVDVSVITASTWDKIDEVQRSRLLCEQAEQFTIPIRRSPDDLWHSMITIVARRGLTVLGRKEAEWLYAWRYSNHLTGAFSGDLILVTEHGWVDFVTHQGGYEPRLERGHGVALR